MRKMDQQQDEAEYELAQLKEDIDSIDETLGLIERYKPMMTFPGSVAKLAALEKRLRWLKGLMEDRKEALEENTHE